jgi:hypothetical protein
MKKYTLLFTITLGLNTMILSQIPNYVPSNGLVGWWPFSGNANDLSGNGNNGIVNGATLIADRNGILNSAFYFDGIDDHIDLTSDFDFPVLSINIWFNAQIINNIIGHVYDADHGMLNNGHIKFFVRENLGDDEIVFAAGGTNLSQSAVEGTWYMGTIVRSPSETKYYFNGVLKSIEETNLLNSNSGYDKALLGCSRLFDRYFNGKIDDIGIWNRSLASCEILDLYNSQLGSFLNSTVSINPVSSAIGSNATLTVSTPIQSLQWQSNPSNIGWVNLSENNNYQGVNNDTLVVSNLQLSNHNQTFRVLACDYTSNISTIQIADTCINTITVYDTTTVSIYDTLYTTVTDTLIINTTLGLPAPNNENTILIYPNPASDFITIDNGNYIAMAGYSIKIENNAGQQVFQSNINQQLFTIDLSTWSGDGLYFVHLIDGQGNTVTVRKIVLQ